MFGIGFVFGEFVSIVFVVVILVLNLFELIGLVVDLFDGGMVKLWVLMLWVGVVVLCVVVIVVGFVFVSVIGDDFCLVLSGFVVGVLLVMFVDLMVLEV